MVALTREDDPDQTVDQYGVGEQLGPYAQTGGILPIRQCRVFQGSMPCYPVPIAIVRV